MTETQSERERARARNIQREKGPEKDGETGGVAKREREGGK